MLSTLYRILTDLSTPFVGLYLRKRLAMGREDRERFAERFGHPSRPRPLGRLIWCHAASVGEATSLMHLIEKIHDIYPDTTVLLTTGTVTAANMMTPRLPKYAIHQYVPVDLMSGILRFLNHWRPSLAIWIESELWPNTLIELRKRSIPTVLLNARMSEKSFRNWHRVKSFAKKLMSTFALCLAQTENDRGRFVALGARPVRCLGNLKYASAPLSVDPRELGLLRQQTTGCLMWVMASTHRGEEEMAIATHKALMAKHSRLLTIIVPRHAARGEEVARLLQESGLSFARRSRSEAICAETQIYLADTMGEVGLFCALSPVTVMGGSFVRVGGHNPIEPAQLGSAIIFGPYMYNFSEIAREFIAAQAAVQLQHDNELPFVIDHLFKHPEERGQKSQAAKLLANHKRYILDQIIVEMEPWLRS